jgi:hypothetical protein
MNNITDAFRPSTPEEREAHNALARTPDELREQGYTPLIICGEFRGWTLPR